MVSIEKKGLAMALIFLGAALLGLAVYQYNQAVNTQVQIDIIKPSMDLQISQMRAAGATETEIQQAQSESLSAGTKLVSSFNQLAMYDGIAGLVLLVAGVLIYPKEKR